MKPSEIKILIVEDDEATGLMMESALEEIGYKVVLKTNAETAWETLQTEGPFQILFLDINLPGMDGLTLCKQIRADQNLDDLYIVAATGKDTPEDLSEILAAGANDYLAKPVHPKFLKIRTRVCLFITEKIQEKRAFQTRLAESEARYRIISENGRDVVMTEKTDGTILYLSPSIENLMGFSIQSMLGRRIQEFVHPEDIEVALPKGNLELLNGSLENTTEFRIRTSDEKYLWVEGLHRAIQDTETGEIKEWITYMREAQGTKTSERRLEALEEILDGAEQDTKKILERLAVSFNGKAILLEEKRTQDIPYEIVQETQGTQSPDIEQTIKFLLQGVNEEQKILPGGMKRSKPYLVPKNIDMLVIRENPALKFPWECGMIQPIPKPSDSEKGDHYLIILSEDEVQEREVRTVKSTLKLAGGILFLKLISQPEAS